MKNKTLREEFEKKFVERTIVKRYATKGWKKGVTANKVWKYIETKLIADELSRQKKEIIEELEKMMEILAKDRELYKNRDERAFYNVRIKTLDQAIKTIYEK